MFVENFSRTFPGIIMDNQHFIKCNHARCNSFFFISQSSALGRLGPLCPHCSKLAMESHVVQCATCKVVIGFVPKLGNEQTQIFSVKKCSHCVGTADDEFRLDLQSFEQLSIM
jgi:glutaredoxin